MLQACAVVKGSSKQMRLPSTNHLKPTLLASEFVALPDPVQKIHDRARCFSASGRCDVDEGRNPVARLIAALFRLPRAGRDLPVTVKFLTRGGREIWERRFGGSLMKSDLRRADHPGHVIERFGSASFMIRLRRDGARLHYDVVAGRVLGVPLPKALLPRSETTEMVADGGRCVMVGIAAAGVTGEVEITRLVRRKLRVLGSLGGRPRHDLAALMQLALDGRLQLGGMISERFALDDAATAYDRLAAGRINGRAIVEMHRDR